MRYLAILAALAVAAACGASVSEADSPPTSPAAESTAAPTETPEALPAETEAVAEESTASGPIASGSFEAAEHPTAGTAQIIQEGDQRYIELSDDFTTDPGPDLFVVLHQSGDFFSATSPPAYGIEEGSYVSIAPLEQVSGAQRYAIPASVNVDDYGSVAIWCRQFNATFGAANLSQ